MASIRIIETPPGEAPEKIRQAWVGLVLPLVDGPLGQRMHHKVEGVLSHPKTRLSRWFYGLIKQDTVWDGYAIEACLAIEILARTEPGAAAWWRQALPHLTEKGSQLIFPANVCEVETFVAAKG